MIDDTLKKKLKCFSYCVARLQLSDLFSYIKITYPYIFHPYIRFNQGIYYT